MEPYQITHTTPSVETYISIRALTGLSPKTPHAAALGLANTLYAVQITHPSSPDLVIGMGRVIGDGGCFFQLVDMAVVPTHQAKGLGKMIMKELKEWMDKNVPMSGTVLLFADGPAKHLYKQFGFLETMGLPIPSVAQQRQLSQYSDRLLGLRVLPFEEPPRPPRAPCTRRASSICGSSHIMVIEAPNRETTESTQNCIRLYESQYNNSRKSARNDIKSAPYLQVQNEANGGATMNLSDQSTVRIGGSLADSERLVCGLVALRECSPDQLTESQAHQRKRQPSTPQAQGSINSVATPGQQSQDITSTAGAGNGADNESGMITNRPAANDEVDCRNITTGRDNKCWEELQLTPWLENWVSNTACYRDEPFASCFLRLERFPGLDCTGVKISACTAPQSDNLLNEPEVFYVAYNIYAVNQFFLSWWTAVGNAASVAADNVGAIVQLLDPISNANTILDDVLIALTGVFALVPGASYLTTTIDKEVSDGWQAFASVLQNALFVVPQIGRWVFPIDSATSQVIQMSELSSQMATIIQMVQDNLNKTVVSVMSNTTEFLAFASQGNFSASAPSLSDQANYLLYAFNTYIISQALNGNNVYGTIGLNTNVQSLATNGSKTAYDFSDCEGYNAQNVCGEWWYSGRYNSSFGLDHFSHMTRSYGDVLTTLLSNYTTGELLFDGAYACNANGNYGQPVNVTVNAAGINTGCLSQLRIVTWDMSCDNPTKHTKHGCEFLEVEVEDQGQFFGAAGSHSMWSVMDEPIYGVPASYLGPLVAQHRIKLQRK